MTDEYLTDRKHIAYMLGVDARSLTTYQKREVDPLPVAVAGKRGQPHKYDLQAVLKWKVRQAVARLGVAGDGTALDLDYERARLAKAQADKTERENLVRAKELAPAVLLEYAISDVAVQCVAIFEGLPKRIKNSLPSLRAREMKILVRELNKARQALSEMQVDFDGFDGG